MLDSELQHLYKKHINIIFKFKEDITNKLCEILYEDDENELWGEWEINLDNNYALYFFEYNKNKKCLLFQNGDSNDNSFKLLINDIYELFKDFEYSIIIKHKIQIN